MQVKHQPFNWSFSQLDLDPLLGHNKEASFSGKRKKKGCVLEFTGLPDIRSFGSISSSKR